MKRILLTSCLLVAIAMMHRQTFAQAPANDNCANATVITPNVICVATAGTSTNATQEFAPTSCSGSTAATALEVWYQFTANGTLGYTINVTGITSFNPVLGLYSSCSAGSLISCVDAGVNNGTETINAGVLTAGTYYFRIYKYNGGSEDFITCLVRTSPLPIELLSFTGACDEQIGSRKLEWVTASEINNDHFTIDRSFDAVNWTEVHREHGAGNSNVQLAYSWTDSAIVEEQLMYYRLSQKDFDGQSETFDWISVSCSSNHAIAMAWQNPNDGNFNVRFSDDAGVNVCIVLTDHMGRVIRERTETATGFDQFISFHEQLSGGMYFLNIQGKKLQTSLKIIVE